MRTATFVVLLALLFSVGIPAHQAASQESAKLSDGNMLSAKQIADGWIQLFDGSTDYGWKSRGEAKWTVTGGALVSEAGKAGSLCTTTEFSNGILHFECSHESSGDNGIALLAPADGTIDSKNATIFRFAAAKKKIGNLPNPRPENEGWTTYDIVARDKVIKVFVNNGSTQVFQLSSPVRGYIGLLSDGKEAVQL